MGALQDYQEAIRLRPSVVPPRISLVNTLRKLGRNSEAIKHEEVASELIQEEVEYNRACFESVRGNTDKALELLKIALEKNQPNGGKAWARQDPDFENIRSDLRFKELVGE